MSSQKKFQRHINNGLFVLGLVFIISCSCKKRNNLSAEPTIKTDSTVEVEEEHLSEQIDPLTDPVEISTQKFTTYTIYKGAHYSDREKISLLGKDSISCKVIFDSTAVYATKNPVNQLDWNKLIGFSDCMSHHHQNSIRVVWRYKDNKHIELGAYWYRNGQRGWKEVATVQPDEAINLSVSTTDSTYQIQINGISHVEARACSSGALRYWLFPYFGGDETAPHDIRIQIQHLYPEF